MKMHRPHRTDKKISLSDMQSISKNSSTLERAISQDAEGYSVKRQIAGSQMFIPATPNIKNNASNPEMFKVKAVTNLTSDKTAFTVRPGIWVRRGLMSASSHGYDHKFDPISDGAVVSDYSGTVRVYTVLKYSKGFDANLTFAPNLMDIENTSSDYNQSNDGSNGLFILYSIGEKKMETGDAFGMFRLLSEVEYSSGVITKIIPCHTGGIQDFDKYHDPNYPSQFEVSLQYDDTTCSTYTVTVGEGNWKVRGETELIASTITASQSDIAGGSNYFWVQANNIFGQDPSLKPLTATIEKDAGYPAEDAYTLQFQKLYVINHTEIALFNGLNNAYVVSVLVDGQIGEHKFDWMRPDGVDSGISAVDTAVPKLASLNFNTDTGAHEAELQDYNAFEAIINGSAVANYDGDEVLKYFDYASAGTTLSKYVRIDASNAYQWDQFSSLELYNDKFQLFDFEQGTAETYVDLTNIGSDIYDFVFRKYDSASGDTDIVYVDGASLQVYAATYSEFANWAYGIDCENIVWTQDCYDNLPFWQTGDTATDTTTTLKGAMQMDNSDIKAFDMTNRIIFDTAELDSVDADTRLLYDSSGIGVISWNTYEILDPITSLPAIDWGSFVLYDSTPVISVSWDGRILYDSSGLDSVDWELRTLNDSTGAAVLNWYNGVVFNAPVNVPDDEVMAFGTDDDVVLTYNSATDTFEMTSAGATTFDLTADNVNFSNTISTTGAATIGGSATGQSSVDSGLVVNNGANGDANADLRVETANVTNALLVDASADLIYTQTGVNRKVTTIVADTPTAATHHIVRANTSAGNVTYTLPASPTEGRELRITCVDSTNTFTVAPNGNNMFGSTSNFTMVAGETIIIVYDSTNGWW